MCDYITCSITDIEKSIKDWVKQKDRPRILVVSFNDHVEGDFDFFDEIEEVQMNIRSQNYPDNVVISFKQFEENPISPDMTKWTDLSEKYWYIIVHEIYRIELFVF